MAIALLTAVLGFSFQGSRGIWEPDEGFYANVSLGMLRTGDWLVPRLNGVPFLDKPPLNYWGMAAGMSLFGVSEWGARVAQALWFIGAVLLVGAFARRLYGAGAGRLAAVIYATTLLPFFAANIVTSDTPLAFCAILGIYCYWRAQEEADARPARLWWVALGAAAGLGILAKGPAMLVFLAPAGLHFFLRRGWKRALLFPWGYVSILVALVVGGSWYFLIGSRLQGAGAYFLDNQAVGRLVTATYRRNAGLAGGLRVYVPALLLGSLPWSALWPFIYFRRRSKGPAPFWRGLAGRCQDLLLVLWIALPLVVLFAASSRLVLYSLPLFAPMAIATARSAMLAFEGEALRTRAWILPAAVAAWCVCLVAGKGVAASLPNEHDSRAIARGIEARLGTTEVELVGVEDKRNGLPFYGYSRFEWVTIEKETYPFFTPVKTLADQMKEMERDGTPRVFLVPREKMSKVFSVMGGAGIHCRDRGPVEQYGLLACAPPGTGG